MGGNGAHVLQQRLPLEDRDVLDGRGTGHGMAGIRVSVREQNILLPRSGDLFQQPIGDQARAEREVAGGQPLGAGQQVRLNAEHLLGREPVAETPEAGDHLIGDVEDVVGAADLQTAPVVSGWGNDDAARRQDRLCDKGAHIVGAELGDRVLEVRDLLVAPDVELRVVRPQRRIHVREEANPRPVHVHPALVAFLSRHRRGEKGRTVICLLSGEHDLLVRPAEAIVVEVHEPERGIDRGGSAGGEEHVVQIARCQVGELLREHRGRFARSVPGRVIGELHDLLGDGVGHLAAAVPDLRAPHAARAVDQPFAG